MDGWMVMRGVLYRPISRHSHSNSKKVNSETVNSVITNRATTTSSGYRKPTPNLWGTTRFLLLLLHQRRDERELHSP